MNVGVEPQLTGEEKAGKAAAERSARLFVDYHNARSPWISQVAIDLDYYLNRQWTAKEKKTLEERGQAALVINQIFPTIQQKLAQLSSHRPVIRAIPTEETDANKAELWNLMIEFVLQQSGAELVELQVKRSHLVTGVGYYYVYFDPYADDGKGEVGLAALTPEIVYVDPNSRKPDYSDADSIIVSQVLTLRQAINMFPDKEQALNDAKDQLTEYEDYVATGLESSEAPMTPAKVNDSVYMAEDVGKVRIIERFTKTRVPWYIVINEAEGAQETVDEATYLRSYRGTPGWDATKITRLRVQKIVSAGDNTFLASEILPVKDYPIVPVPNIWIGTPFPLSDTRYMRGPQDEVNKSRSLAILHQTKTAGATWLAEEGSIVDGEWEKKKHIPGAVLKFNAGSVPPREIFPPPTPNSIVQREMQAKHDIKEISGVFSVSHGDPSQAPETYGATLALEEYANRRAMPSTEMLIHAKQIVGRLIIRYCQEYYRLPKYVRVVGSDEKVQGALINNGGGSDLDQAEYDVVIQSGRFAPTNRMAYAQFMLSLYEKGLIDQQAALEALDIPNKEKLIERVALQNQQAGTIRALEDELKASEGQIQTLMRELQHAGVKTVVDESRVEEKDARNEHEVRMARVEVRKELERGAAALALKGVVQDAKLASREQALAAREKAATARTSGKSGAGKTKGK